MASTERSRSPGRFPTCASPIEAHPARHSANRRARRQRTNGHKLVRARRTHPQGPGAASSGGAARCDRGTGSPRRRPRRTIRLARPLADRGRPFREAKMDAYDVCSACARHIKRQERCCPFCDAAHSRPGSTRPWMARVSRAQWLAFGSTLAAAGCLPTVSTESPLEGGVGVLEDASPNVFAGCNDASATFFCGPNDDGGGACCNRATQYCSQNPYSGARRGCSDFGAGLVVPFPTHCLPSPTCECISGSAVDSGTCGNTMYVRCDNLDDGGGLGLSCYGPCYGSPPARLERAESAPRIRERMGHRSAASA
jgi:hypothetical protein